MARRPLLTLLLMGCHRPHLAAFLVFLLADLATHLDVLNMAKLLAERLFEVFESQHDDGDVVESLVSNRRLHDLFDDIAANLMNLLIFGMEVLLGRNPRLFDHLGVADFVEYSVTYVKRRELSKR